MRASLKQGIKRALDRPGLRWTLRAVSALADGRRRACDLARERFVESESTVLRLVGRTRSRRLLAATATAYARARRGDVFRISPRDGMWVHEGHSGFIVDREIMTYRALSHMDDATRDTWEFLYKPAPGDVVVDVGAGIGAEVHRFSQAVGPSGLVIALEAQPETFRCLETFCELNHLDNVRPLNVAISDTTGTVMIDDGASHLESSIVGTAGGVEVPSTTIDTLLEDMGVTSVDFLKMNIEGAERLAIRGMTRTTRALRCLSISCHDFRADCGDGDFFRTEDEVAEFLQRNEFRIIPRDDDERPWIRDQLNATRHDA